MSLRILNRDEVQEITGKKQRQAQVIQLKIMGIDFKLRPDGLPLVAESVVAEALGVTQKSGRNKAAVLNLPV